MQESDIQIRGFKLRLPLDIQFIFTANPEDYTNRGSIVTPLKDRIDSQILTHYPRSISVSKEITKQEALPTDDQKSSVFVHELLEHLIEQIAFEARQSEYIDSKSGVSARLTISSYENLISTAERRLLLNGESKTHARILDLYGVIPSITGKVELVYEGEQEGPSKVANILIGKAIKTVFENYFPSPEKTKKSQNANPYQSIIGWFSKENSLDLVKDNSDTEYEKLLKQIPGLTELVKKYFPNDNGKAQLVLMEFVLHGLAEFSMLSKYRLDTSIQFKDMLSSMFSLSSEDDEDLNDNSELYR